MPAKRKKHIGLSISITGAILFIALYFIYQNIGSGMKEDNLKNTYTLAAEAKEDIGRNNTYGVYLKKFDTAKSPKDEIEINLFEYTDSKEVEIKENFSGEEKVLLSKEEGFVEWNVEVKEAGLYSIYIEYFPVKSKGIDIERIVYINGEVPFLGADTITLSRVWTDKGEAKVDNRGNEIKPSQIEAPRWEADYFKDYMGYYVEPYQFYFNKGMNSIKLEVASEPMAIRKIVLKNTGELKSYKDYIASFNVDSYKNSDKDYMYKVQGEDATFRSAPTLYAIYDRSSSNTEPYSAAKIKLNMAGGEQWKVPGQWMEWEIEVPEDGMYALSIKGRQNYNRGFVSNRKVLIDGKVPFKEISTVPFKYSNEWNLVTLGEEEPYSFPLTKGKHIVRMEITLGELGEYLNTLEESVFRLNEMYRKILILTGTQPDRYRDYQIEKVYPEIISAMERESEILLDLVEQLVSYSGQKGSQVAAAQTVANQLIKFADKPEKIPPAMENFKTNIGSLGTSILTMTESPLDIDYLIVSAIDAEIPVVKENFIDKVVHETRSFFASFFEDYDSIGNVYEDEENTVEVWVLSGRDQSQIIKNMIDDTFTPETGIGVNVKLISQEVLLPSVVAGTGPDVAINVPQTEPVNFALRNAAEDLSKYEGFDEISKNFYDSALLPYRYNGGIYAIPETQNYQVMFYRKDIMEELGLEIPQTWEEVIKILPTIQKNNMNFGIPTTEKRVGNANTVDISAFLVQLYQRRGTLYSEDASKSIIDAEVGVEAFEFWTKLFTHYKLPLTYDFVNRFRTGEMPLGIADYNTFNTLSVFAPEIRGLWSFSPLPGVTDENRRINRASSSWGVNALMLSDTKNKDASWEFLKWWADTDTQVRFGREMESIMGASARYATANTKAFEQLAWSNANNKTLKEQWEWVECAPEVPGGYYTSRHIVNAYRKVVYNNEDPRETLLDYTRTINDELEKKRKEFGLTTGD